MWLSLVGGFHSQSQQLHRMQSTVTMYARKAMLGQATTWYDDYHPKSLSSEAVLRWWRLVPLELEMRTRRLRLWQSLARVPGAHRQVLASLFGAFGGSVLLRFSCLA